MIDKKERLISFKKSTDPGRLPGDFKVLIRGYDPPNEIIWAIGAVFAAIYMLSIGSFWGCILCLAFVGLCGYKTVTEIRNHKAQKQIKEAQQERLALNVNEVIKQIKGGN